MNYIISQYLVFEKNDQGGILPETRWSRRTRLYNEGRAEALSNWKEYDNDTRALTQLNNALQNNGQTITDNAERQKIADKTLKNASERAKEYGNQIVANTKTLSDFKKENEVEDPNKQVKPKFTDGLKSFASSALSSIGNAVVSAGTAMIAQQLISWGLQGIDAIVHWDDNIIAKGKEAKETILEQNQTYKDQKSQLEELQEQYTKYASGVKISGNIIKNATLSDEDFQAFLDTSNQIANLAPSMIDGWDSEGNAILKFGTDTKEANQQISDYIQLQRDVTHLSIRDNLQDEYKGVVKDAEKTGKEISNKKDQKKEADTIASGWTALKNATETDGPITFTTTAPQKEVEELLDKYKVTSLITIVTTLDSTADAVDKSKVLYDDALEELYVESHPQYTYTDDVENVYALPEFKEYHEQLAVNDFVRVGITDTNYIKLRVIEITYNPCDLDESMEVTFSNMIQYKAKRNDYNTLLNDALNTSNRNGGRVNSVNKSSTSDYVITSEAIKQIFSNPLFNSMLGGTVTGGTGSGGTITADTIIAELVKANRNIHLYSVSFYLFLPYN